MKTKVVKIRCFFELYYCVSNNKNTKKDFPKQSLNGKSFDY